MFDLARYTIFLTLAGSHAHGTARERSDIDLRGVCVAPFDLRVSYWREFEQYEGTLRGPLAEQVSVRLQQHPTARAEVAEDNETVIFDIAKFVRLCAACNPNALEILFADPSDWLHATELWELVHDNRKAFLSLKVQQTYLGYAMGQLKRIESHRAWLLDPPKHKPTRAGFELPEQGTLGREDRDRIEEAIAGQVRAWSIDELEMTKATRIALKDRLRRFWADALETEEDSVDESLRSAACRTLGLSPEVVAALNSEKRYQAALKHWHSYQTWKRNRNPRRAELEAKFGYDTKHAMHLIRLMRCGLEVLRTGDLVVRRPDSDELLAVLDGAYTYDQLIAEAQRLENEMADAAEQSSLPADVEHEFLDELLRRVVESAYSRPI